MDPIKNKIRWQIRQFKQHLFQHGDLPFSDLIPARLLANIVEHTDYYREGIFSPLLTLKAFLFQVLCGDSACQQAVARIVAERLQKGQAANSMNTGPYCKARQRLPLQYVKEAANTIGRTLHKKSPQPWRWKGYNVVLADGSTALMPDTPENQDEFPQQSNQKEGLGFPIVRFVALISLSVGTVIDYAVGPYQGKGTGETSLFSQLIETLSVGDLLLADRYYCTYAIIALLQRKGVPVLFQNHASRLSDFRRGQKLGAKDHLIDWQKPKKKPIWLSQDDYDALPDVIPVRECRVNGVVYLTTLIDPKLFPKKALASLYKQRWQVELDLRTIKTHMGMEMLRCKTPEMVKKEMAVHLLAYNLIRIHLARAAKLYDKTPRLLSFKAAVQVFNYATMTLLMQVGKTFKNNLLAFFKAMASTPIGKQLRKKQPRAVKRRPKAYPLLMVPRQVACNALL